MCRVEDSRSRKKVRITLHPADSADIVRLFDPSDRLVRTPTVPIVSIEDDPIEALVMSNLPV